MQMTNKDHPGSVETMECSSASDESATQAVSSDACSRSSTPTTEQPAPAEATTYFHDIEKGAVLPSPPAMPVLVDHETETVLSLSDEKSHVGGDSWRTQLLRYLAIFGTFGAIMILHYFVL